MTTWIGAVGSMVPTLCASELPVTQEDRWMTGGGEGTLAPRRHLMLTMHGPGARTWSFSRGACATDEAAPLQSLVRAQARSGGAWRFVPCGAVHSNMLTPGASEEFAGWLGTSSPLGLNPVVDESGQRDWGLIVRATGLQQSPQIPLLGRGPWQVTAGLHVLPGAANVHLSLQAFNLAGASLSTVSLGSVTAGSVTDIRRVVRTATITDASAVSWRLRATSSETYTIARPSVAQHDQPAPWRPGQAADAVVLRSPSTAPIIDTPGTALSSVSYIAEETGV